MSDDDFMGDSDFGDSDNENVQGGDSDGEGDDVENQYYIGESSFDDNEYSAALESFETVIEKESPKGVWGLKSLSKMIRIYSKKNKPDKMLQYFKQLLEYLPCVPSTDLELEVVSTLDFLASSLPAEGIIQFYELSMAALKTLFRLWFKIGIKFGKMLLEQAAPQAGTLLSRLLRDLHTSCQNEDGTDDLKKGTQLLDVYALEIQWHTLSKNTKALKAPYTKALRITEASAASHPLTMGIIRECGGKMHLHEEQFSEAVKDFFEAFKSYDESGSPKKLSCLKYLVLSNMLLKSKVDPFDAQESKPYRNDPQILAMTNLVRAYQDNDIHEFEKILKNNQSSIMGDSFVAGYIQDLLKNIRTEVLVKLIKPYTRVHIGFVAKELNITPEEVETLTVASILDGTVHGRIDQVNRMLLLERSSGAGDKYSALNKWTSQLDKIYSTIVVQSS